MTCKTNMDILKLIASQEIGLLTSYLQARSEAELTGIIDALISFLDDADKLRGIIADVISHKKADEIKKMDYES